MAPAIEVLFAPALEAYRHDPSVFDPVLEIVASTNGSLGIYHGYMVEDPSILFLLVIWDTIESHHALMNNAPAYTRMADLFASCADVPKLDLFHVYFDGDLTPVLRAPYASVTHIMSLKPDTTPNDMERAILNMVGLPGVQSAKGAHGAVWGKAVEKDEYVIISGWDDPKDHEVLRVDEETVKAANTLRSLIDKRESGHVKLIRYKEYDPQV